MSARTPGPWKAHATSRARSGLPEYEIHWSDDSECVAEIVHGKANALLIAAAPDSLAALLRVEYLLADIANAKNEYSAAAEDALFAIGAAIAKATGATS